MLSVRHIFYFILSFYLTNNYTQNISVVKTAFVTGVS